MTSLLQGAIFTVGLINSDRREILELLWLLGFPEIKEMLASDRIIIVRIPINHVFNAERMDASSKRLENTPMHLQGQSW